MEQLAFVPVDQEHADTVRAWLVKDHVSPYFYGEGLQNTFDDLDKYLDGGESLYRHWIALADGTAFAYLMTSVVDPVQDADGPFSKWIEEGKLMITLDLLIGEEAFLGKGLSSLMIRKFLLDTQSGVDIVFIDPALENSRAVHVYEKAGFVGLEEFTPRMIRFRT